MIKEFRPEVLCHLHAGVIVYIRIGTAVDQTYRKQSPDKRAADILFSAADAAGKGRRSA